MATKILTEKDLEHANYDGLLVAMGTPGGRGIALAIIEKRAAAAARRQAEIDRHFVEGMPMWPRDRLVAEIREDRPLQHFAKSEIDRRDREARGNGS